MHGDTSGKSGWHRKGESHMTLQLLPSEGCLCEIKSAPVQQIELSQWPSTVLKDPASGTSASEKKKGNKNNESADDQLVNEGTADRRPL